MNKKLIPLPQFEQYECRNESLEVYASDRRGQVTYTFNNLGYRNSVDYVDRQQPIGIYIGSSITSGIGLNWQESFAYISSQKFQVEPWQFSQGCVRLNNQQNLETLRTLIELDLNVKYWVIQFINLDRCPSTATQDLTDTNEIVTQFNHTFNQIEQLLKNQVWCFLGSDKTDYPIDPRILSHNKCVGWNIPYIDLSGVGEHPGPKWHRMIAAGIDKKLSGQLNKS